MRRDTNVPFSQAINVLCSPFWHNLWY